MELDNLIFDRTQADVDRAKYLAGLWQNGTFTGTTAELAEWVTDLKGAYNATDLNRVIAAMDYLNEYFLGLGYDVGYTKIRVPHQAGSAQTLPDGYTGIEYIQANGSQYINTGYPPNQDLRIVCSVSNFPNTSISQILFGSRSSTSANDKFTFLATAAEQYRTDYGSQDITIPASVNYAGELIIDKNKNVTTLNGNEVYTANEAQFSSTLNVYIFACNTNGSPNAYANGARLNYFRMYNNSVLIRNFTPCKNPDGVIGLYDFVNGEFYQNAGNGSFTAGPNSPPPEPTKDPYTWYEDDIPTQNEMNIYIEDVSRLRDKIPLLADTPETPEDMQLLTYQEANDIERILDNIERVLIAMENSFLLRQANTLFMIAGGVFNNA